MQRFAAVLSKLKGLKKAGPDGWKALCPAHEDTNSSLSIKVADDKLLINCHAGCDWKAVITALGVETGDLFAEPLTSTALASPSKKKWEFVESYDYEDKHGVKLFEVVRFNPKTFRPRRKGPDGKSLWNIDGCDRPLYRLHLLVSTPPDRHVWVVEGEKDVDRLVMAGLIATTNVGGAGKWLPEYNQHFKGRPVLIVPDNDVPGLKHAAHVEEQLRPLAKSVTILQLPGLPEKGDVCDYLDSHTTDELIALATEQESGKKPAPAAQAAETAAPPASDVIPDEGPAPFDGEDERAVRAEVGRRMRMFVDTSERMLIETVRRFFAGLREMSNDR